MFFDRSSNLGSLSDHPYILRDNEPLNKSIPASVVAWISACVLPTPFVKLIGTRYFGPSDDFVQMEYSLRTLRTTALGHRMTAVIIQVKKFILTLEEGGRMKQVSEAIFHEIKHEQSNNVILSAEDLGLSGAESEEEWECR